jgi:Phospholipase_D-nuclease N-terminal
MFANGIPTELGIGFVLSAILAFWGVFNIFQNKTSGPFGKAVWSFLVLFVPFFGFVLWFLFGPKAHKE